MSCSPEVTTRGGAELVWEVLEKLWSGSQAGQPIGRIASLVVSATATGVFHQGRAEAVKCRAAYRGAAGGS
jgi:hypothetical protein